MVLLGARIMFRSERSGSDRASGRRLLSVACFAVLLACTSRPAAAAGTDQLVFLDNDFAGPGGSDIQSLLPLLHRPGVRLLGLGVVTGDAWRDEETAHLLRFLEIADARDVPVHQGAVSPLRRTRAEMLAWEGRYGRLLWKGAWQTTGRHGNRHADDAGFIPPLAEGSPTLRPAPGSAADAMVAAVRAHPHEVTIITAGPMTDLALAIRADPTLPRMAKALVFMGGLVDTFLPQLRAEQNGGIDYYTDFNMLFDPEAAHAVLTAAWPQITCLGNVTLDTVTTPAVIADIARSQTPVAQYIVRYAEAGTPFWDEIATAVAVQPDLVTGDVVAAMDVDTDQGVDYGRVHLWPQRLAPAGVRAVHVVQSIDGARFLDEFREEAARPPGG